MDARTPTLGSQIDKLATLKDKKSELDAKVKDLETEISELTETIIQRLQAEETDRGAGKKMSVTIGHEVVANIIDYEAFWAFVVKAKAPQLLQRRVSNPAFREMLEYRKGKPVPSLEPFTKIKLNTRKITKE